MNFIIITNEIMYTMEEFNSKKEYLVQHSQILRKLKDYYKINKDCGFLFMNEVNYILKLSEEKFVYSAPEVVDHCYGIVFSCKNLEDKYQEWYKYVKSG
jgi:hypothetical protein